MTADVWWHGTPDTTFPPRKIVPKDSMFRAVFLTASPLVAAFYAGEGGVVHGFTIRRAAPLLDTTEETGTPQMSEDEIRKLDEFCLRYCDGGFQRIAKPYFDRGTSNWDNALLVLGQMPELGARALRAMGYDGFLRREWTRWAYGDRLMRASKRGRPYDDVVERIALAPNSPHRVAAMTDPAQLVPFASHASCTVAEMIRCGCLDANLREERQALAA